MNNIESAYNILRNSFNVINDLTQNDGCSIENVNINYRNIRQSYLNNMKEILVNVIEGNNISSHHFANFIDINVERQLNLIADDNNLRSKVGAIKIINNDDIGDNANEHKAISTTVLLNEIGLNKLSNTLMK